MCYCIAYRRREIAAATIRTVENSSADLAQSGLRPVDGQRVQAVGSNMSLLRTVLLVALAALPLLEIALLIKIGGWLGGWLTFFIILGTAVLGTSIIVQNGFSAALRMQQAMMRGEAPFGPMIDSAMVVLAGLLLITPGFIADTVGLLLLVPPLRRLAAAGLARLMLDAGVVTSASATYEERTTAGTSAASGSTGAPGSRGSGSFAGGRGGDADGPVIEGEFRRVDERPIDPRGREDSDRR